MDIRLIVVSGKHAGREILIQPPRFVIGRDEGCHLRPNSDQVEGRHCEIVADNTNNTGTALVRDFGSQSGTFINQQRVVGERDLRSGDRLRVANLEFEIRLSTAIGGKKKPKVQTIQDVAARTMQSATGDGLDVSAWLNRLDNTANAPLMEEFRFTETESTAEQHPLVQQTSEKKDPNKRSVLFKPAQNIDENKPSATTSRDAAAETLRQLFGE